MSQSTSTKLSERLFDNDGSAPPVVAVTNLKY